MSRLYWFFRNLSYYWKFLWNDRDWDSSYTFRILQAKLEKQRQHLRDYDVHSGYTRRKVNERTLSKAIAYLKRYNQHPHAYMSKAEDKLNEDNHHTRPVIISGEIYREWLPSEEYRDFLKDWGHRSEWIEKECLDRALKIIKDNHNHWWT